MNLVRRVDLVFNDELSLGDWLICQESRDIVIIPIDVISPFYAKSVNRWFHGVLG